MDEERVSSLILSAVMLLIDSGESPDYVIEMMTGFDMSREEAIKRYEEIKRMFDRE